MLSIARLKKQSVVLGPGRRAVVWFHGCSRRCPDCIAKEMNEAPPLFVLSPKQLYKWVCDITEIEGITLSGGEPFEQDPESMKSFLEMVKCDSRGLSVMCYTGNTLSEIKNNPVLSRLLSFIDILVDGAYIYDQDSGQKWRGSSNQVIYALNEEYGEIVASAEEQKNREIEISLTKDLRIEITGIPKKGFLRRLEEQLDNGGYYISSEIEK